MTNDPPPQQPPEPEEPLEEILAEFLNLMDEANQLLLPDEEVERRLRRITGDEFPEVDEHGLDVPPPGDPGDRVQGEQAAASEDLGFSPLPEPSDRADASRVDPSVRLAAEEIKARAREEAARIRAAAQLGAKQILDDAQSEAENIKAAARTRADAIKQTAKATAEDYEDKGIRKAAEELVKSKEAAKRILADAERVLEDARDEAERIIALADAHARGRIEGAQENVWLVHSALGLPPPPHLGDAARGVCATAATRELMVHGGLPLPAATAATAATAVAPVVPPASVTSATPSAPFASSAPFTSSGPPSDDEAAHDIELVDDEPEMEEHRDPPDDGELGDDFHTFPLGPGRARDVRSALPWSPRRVWPSSGSVHCPMIAASAIHAGLDGGIRYGDGFLRHIRDSLYQIMRDTFDRAGIGWAACRSYDRGDSVLILVPPDVLPELLATPLIHGTRAGVLRHNRLASHVAQVRIRMAVHMGTVHFDQAGATGRSLELLNRLMDYAARPGITSGDFGLATSAYVYENVIRHYSDFMDLDDFQPIRLPGEDDFQAWGYFPAITGAGGWLPPPDAEPDPETNLSGRVVVGDHDVRIRPQGTVVAVRTRPASRVVRRSPRPDRGTPTGADRPLVGRYEELARLAAWLDAGEPVLVYGPPGVGKSALLRFFAGQRVAAGAEVVSMSAAGMGADDVVHALFRRCYDADDHRPGPERLRSLMSTVGALVVVDDFTGSAKDAEALVDLVSGGALIIIARDRIDWKWSGVLELLGLPEGASRALLDAELGDRVWNGDDAAAWKLSRSTRGNPRALLQAVAVARAAEGTALPAGPDEAVRALWRSADTDVRAVLRVLCALSGTPVPPGLLIRLAEVTDDGRRVLNDLLWTRLAQRTGPGYVATCAPGLPVTGADRSPADFVGPLTAWVVDASSSQVAESAAVIIAVLADAVRTGAHAPACELARAAAPALGVTLWWGAWGRVLSLGGGAARLAGSAEDAAYFDGEERMRLLVLGSLTAPDRDAAPDDAAPDGVAPDDPDPDPEPDPDPDDAAGPGPVVSPRTRRRARLVSCGLITTVVVALVAVGVFCASLFGYGLFGNAKASDEPPPASAYVRVPPTLVAGADSTVLVSGFSPGEQVWFMLSGAQAPLATVTMKRDGNATATIRQRSPQGRYTVFALGMTSGRVARTDFRLV